MEQHLQAESQDLGHYTLVRKLGEGGFGEVYQAWDTRLQRHVAIKRLKSQVLSSRPGHLLDEARLAASLRHPAFVRIFGIEGDAHQQSIVMEYVDGSTLRQLAQSGPMPEARVRDIVRQVALAMQEAHAANMVHGDLKPSNLMLDAMGAVRILDFGLASKIDPDATESVAFEQTEGTVAYLAPELLLGARQNAQSDIYALGVVAYEMLTGARPFSHLGGLALAAAHIQSSSDLWVFPPEVSAPMAALVRSMTARDLSRRIPSMEALMQAAGEHGAAPASAALAVPAPLLSLNTPGRKKPWGLVAGVAAVLVVVLGYLAVNTKVLQRFEPSFSTAAQLQAGMDALVDIDNDERINAAIASFNTVLERHPENAAAAAGLSLAYSLRYAGDRRDPTWLQRADASAQLAIKLNDQLALAYAALGTVRVWQGKPEEALRLEDRALLLDPRLWTALSVKAETLIRMRRFDEAELTIAAGQAAHPGSRVFSDILGTLRFSQARYKDAEMAFRSSISREPNGVAAYGNLSEALVRQNRADEALQVLQQGLQVRKSGRLYSNLGNVLFGRGEYVAAAEAFQHVVSPELGGAAEYLNWANLADTLRWIPGREADAESAYRQALALLKPQHEKSPADFTMMSRMGLYLAHVGEKEAATAMTLRALAAAPASADVHFRAAVALEITGQRDRALAELGKALTNGYPANLVSVEPDLVALRRDPRYQSPQLESKK
jgi:tetratricopeptide (TPR) repeat protein/tRNA A-37 threonylcarbamoyl transferase component Bud32